MAVWQCRLLLGIVCVHLALSSPVVRRDVLALTHEQANPLAQLQPETLGEEAFGGPVAETRSSREKRLLKTVGLGALAVKGAKAVGAKVVTGAAKAVGAKLLKTSALVKTAAAGTIGLKAKAIGVKTVTAVAALGIKALLFKLLFGKINQLITHKERLLNQLDNYNKVQNEKLNQQLFPPCRNPTHNHGSTTYTVAPAYNAAPAAYPTVTSYTPEPLPYSPEPLPYSPEPLPQLSKSSLQPRQQKTVTATSETEPQEAGEVPEFDPNKISLQVPDELFAPAFNSVNNISTIIGNLIQNTAERVARLVERLKPLLRSSLGFRSRKRHTEKEEEKKNEDTDTDELSNSETTFFTDSDEIQEVAGSETNTSTAEDSDNTLHSSIKTSYTALVDNS